MDNKSKEIIIVSYQFCPMGGIGTRRWSKFAKYLALNNYKVHIICSSYKISSNINWCHDVLNNPNIIIHKINLKYPQFLLSTNRTFLIKLIEKTLKYLFFTIDFGQYSKSNLEKKIESILVQNSNIKTIITTGATFSQFYYLSKIKNKFNFNLILDYRDPWNFIHKFKGPFKSFFKRKSIEKEIYSLKKANFITFTNKELCNKYLDAYPFIKNKSSIIFNGYDKQDYLDLKIDLLNNNKYNIIYLGSLTNGRLEAIKLILDVLILNPLEFEKIQLNLFCPSYSELKKLNSEYVKVINKHIIQNKILPPKEAISQILKNDACLSINERKFSYLIGAKTYDYMALNKSILHISEEGELSDILERSGHFVSNYNIENCTNALKKLLLDNKSKKLNSNFKEFDIENINKDLIKLIENVQNI